MPIYAFQCAACGHAFDRLQKLSDADPQDCPECAQAQVRRLLTAPQFRLAGGGWYETDFKKDGDRKRNLAGDGGSGESKDGKKAPDDGAAGSKPTESKASDGKTSDGKPAGKQAQPVSKVEAKPATPEG